MWLRRWFSVPERSYLALLAQLRPGRRHQPRESTTSKKQIAIRDQLLSRLVVQRRELDGDLAAFWHA